MSNNMNGKEKVHLKLQLSMVESGIVAKLSDQAFKMLIVIASFMDEKGKAFPTQEQIALRCGWSVRKVQRVKKELEQFEWDGKPIITVEKKKSDRSAYFHDVFRIQPTSQLYIFKGQLQEISSQLNHIPNLSPSLEADKNHMTNMDELHDNYGKTTRQDCRINKKQEQETITRYVSPKGEPNGNILNSENVYSEKPTVIEEGEERGLGESSPFEAKDYYYDKSLDQFIYNDLAFDTVKQISEYKLGRFGFVELRQGEPEPEAIEQKGFNDFEDVTTNPFTENYVYDVDKDAYIHDGIEFDCVGDIRIFKTYWNSEVNAFVFDDLTFGTFEDLLEYFNEDEGEAKAESV